MKITMQEALNVINENPCAAWNPEIFGTGWSDKEQEAARKSWHAAIYAAALAMSTSEFNG